MRRMPRATRFGILASLAVLALGAGVSTVPAILTPSPPKMTKPIKTPPALRPAGPPADADFAAVERLVNDQKMEEASRLNARLLERARRAGDEDAWTRALVSEVQLRTALHGYETSVRFLKEQPWPRGAISHAVLNLFYAATLVDYEAAYSFEIGQRERVESKGSVDLKAWTREQIFEEATRAYVAVWKDREALGAEPVTRIERWVSPNTYPKEVRGSLRDAVSYFFAELLADTRGWRPEQSNELYSLDGAALVAGDFAKSKLVALADPAVHPLVRIGAVLDDLEAWHHARGEKEARLEARLERLRRLHASFTNAEDRALVRADLQKRLPGFREVPWWSMGQADLAEFLRDTSAPGNLVKADAAAREGWRAYPASIGGARCRSIAELTEAPDYQLQSMSSDGPEKRSISVTHKNLAEVSFRAFAIDLPKRLATSKDWNLLPQGDELKNLVRSGRPAAAWTTPLPSTPDFKLHRTYVTPPLRAPGAYVVVASARRDFAPDPNRLLSVFLVVSDLVLVSRREADGALEVRAVSGETGRPVAGARVALWAYDWKSGHHEADSRAADAEGLLHFAMPTETGRGYFLYGRNGADQSLDASGISFFRTPAPSETTASLVYTDRSVYRPAQKVFWKIVAYRGRADLGRLRTLPNAAATVSLYDANNQQVDTRTVATNGFGSAAGEFAVPAGRLLGAWRVVSSLGGQASVRVEEYKRPTFEATLKEPPAALRLNQPARLTGEARYYFGLPVTSGSVRWRVTRERVFPIWWGWWLARTESVQTIATGSAKLREDGSFELVFTPAADERSKREKGVTFRYRVAADVTDEGGETRSASRSFRLGFVAVEARVDVPAAFFREGAPATATIVRSDLDGAPRAGAGTFTLTRLVAPERAFLPADQPLEPTPEESGGEDRDLATPGDRLRPRFTALDPWERVVATWRDGPEVTRGALRHDAKGEAPAALGTLAPGAYRLHYTTKDDFGAAYETMRDVLVAGTHTALPLPALLLAESSSVRVGETARLLVVSGLPAQTLYVDIYRGGALADRRRLEAGKDATLIEIPIAESDRGGFGATLTAVRDHQLLQATQSIFVPWDDRELAVSFATFRDELRPGAKETWRVKVKGPAGRGLETGAAELLAYMYDKSLDVFAPHSPPAVSGLYPNRSQPAVFRSSLGQSPGLWVESSGFPVVFGYSMPAPDILKFLSGYGIGGPGRRGGVARGVAGGVMAQAAVPKAAMVAESRANGIADYDKLKVSTGATKEERKDLAAAAPEPADTQLRSDFAETAFFRPNLLTDGDGTATIEFTVPDSVTAWNVWVHAVTRDLAGGSLHKETRSMKELIVRPYLPRFLRESDRAEIKVVVNDAGKRDLSGRVTLEAIDPATNESVSAAFGLPSGGASAAFAVKPGGGADVTFTLTAPKRVGPVAFRVVATSGDTSDGELRPLPVLPSLLHLSQSRFVTLKNRDRKTMTFADLAKGGDPSLVNEQLVVTVDAQLFYSVLQALPYLVDYPYECTEQTLNRFLSTGIVSSVYKDYPAVARMAAELAKRRTHLETWDAADPNRKMGLEETPWLQTARGGPESPGDLTNVLDPRIAKAERDTALAKLRKAQTAVGAFPWWPGGPPSPYMTLYILHGFAKAAEFGVDVPKDVVQRAWAYLGSHYHAELHALMAKDCCWELLTFLNYVASCSPDSSWTGDALTPADRKEILAFSFKHWRQHSPYLKGYLTLTLKRMGRPADAKLVWDSVMDSSKTTEELGTFWAPEDRGWLWYNDTTETHAFALRTLSEFQPDDVRRHGLVQWILLDKKLRHWKSTKATAEVIYSLVHYLKKEGALGVREDAKVVVGPQTVSFTFEPDVYTGKKNQVVIPGEKVDPRTMSTVVVEKESPGTVFASATWSFATEKLPAEERGDFFDVIRRYFRREAKGREVVLVPLAEGAAIGVGDELEVHLSLRAKHAAEYVHLRDPRGAGFEPENAVSKYRWDLGIAWYEEIRDSGTNFFFEWLPVGEYAFKYRVRAATAGTFRVGPATVQSMYAPEFHAYSAGNVLKVARAE
jgi:hypothetical protein